MWFGSNVQKYSRALRPSPNIKFLEYDDKWFISKRIVQKACNECERFDQCLKEELLIATEHNIRDVVYKFLKRRADILIYSLISR